MHKCGCGKHHVTKAEYDKLTPRQQGYVVYMQAAHPHSELKHVENHYPLYSKQWKEYEEGAVKACLEAQDSEG